MVHKNFLKIAFLLVSTFFQQLFFLFSFYMYCDRFITKTKIFTSLKNLARLHMRAWKVIRFAQLVPMSLIMFSFYHFIRAFYGILGMAKSFFSIIIIFLRISIRACVFVHFNTYRHTVYNSTFPWHLLECTFCKFSRSFSSETPSHPELRPCFHLKCSPHRPMIDFKFFLPFQTKQSSSAIIFDSMAHFLS